ncbi:hypothetical protein BDV93DRAFT_579801 [Ceratobasidium sp. AG-I]|nr:hypothetical protein BDV93DRAFT_579801 [Ceratobasidium sp. AG-I]
MIVWILVGAGGQRPALGCALMLDQGKRRQLAGIIGPQHVAVTSLMDNSLRSPSEHWARELILILPVLVLLLLSPSAEDTMFAGIKKVKQKAKQKAHRYADNMFGSPSSERLAAQSSSVSISHSGTTNTPVPTAALPHLVPNLNVLVPPSTSPQVTSIAAPQPVVASPALLSTGTPPMASPTNDSPAVQDSVELQDSSSAPVASSGAERSGKNMAWSGLKALIRLLNKSAEAFGPLKSAIGEISRCIEIYERAAKGREDYKTLATELDSLFKELSGYLEGPTPPVMTSSLKNLAK